MTNGFPIDVNREPSRERELTATAQEFLSDPQGGGHKFRLSQDEKHFGQLVVDQNGETVEAFAWMKSLAEAYGAQFSYHRAMVVSAKIIKELVTGTR